MKTLLTAILGLILMFGYAIGAYIGGYKLGLTTKPRKVLAAIVVGTVATAATFVICLVAVWPPVM